MPIAKEVIGVMGDECQCGRRATVRHCIKCGSTRIYARMDRLHTFTDGSQRYVAVQLRCQGCGNLFVEEERTFCDAPPVGPKLAAQKARALYEARQSGESLSTKEEQLVKAMDTLLGTTDTEQAQRLEKEVDRLLSGAWADAVFAHKSGKGPNPGPIGEFKTQHREQAMKLLVDAKAKGQA